MNAHTSYKIYPKAINDFINNNYDLNTINFGNIKNNVTAILQKLKIDDTLDCEWDISPLYFFDKKNISKNNNKPTDFDDYSNFKFIFNLRENKSTKEYEKAIQTLESSFIKKYQSQIEKEIQKHKEQLLIKKRKREQIIYSFIFVILIILTSIIISSMQQ